MFHVISFILAVAAAGSHPVRRTSGSCEGLINGRTETRLRRALEPLLSVGSGRLIPEKKRLTEELVLHVANDLTMLPAAVQDEFITTIERAERTRLLGRTRREAASLKSTEAYVTVSRSRGLVLRVDTYAGASLKNWVILDHELKHLLRFSSGAPHVDGVVDHVRSLSMRPYGHYREEFFAYRGEYRFLRQAYPPARVLKLKKALGTLVVPDVSPLEEAKILTWSKETPARPIVDEFELARGGKVLNALLDRWVEVRSEIEFEKLVDFVTSHSEGEYVRQFFGKEARRTQVQQNLLWRPLYTVTDWVAPVYPNAPRIFDRMLFEP